MQDIIIVCAGGFGWEVYDLIRDINNDAVKNKQEQPYNILGFIDDNLYALEGKRIDAKVIGTIEDWEPNNNEVYAMGLATPKTKEIIAEKLENRGAKFVSLISPRTIMSDNIVIEEGSIIKAYSIGHDARIGKFVNVMGSMVGEDCCIGDYSTITGFANTTNAQIGKRVFVGSQVAIMNGRKIGDDAFICAGSVVFNHVKSGRKVFGVPAKKVEW